jgi:triacylglycerol lipase
LGEAAHQRTTSEGGIWGPFTAKPTAYYEFLLRADQEYPITHFYRTPFSRSSSYIHQRLRPLSDRDKGSGSLVALTRPRGYLGHGRDTFLIDGKLPPGINEGVPGTAEGRIRFEPGALRSVRVVLNKESLTVVTYPFDLEHIVIAEFHY